MQRIQSITLRNFKYFYGLETKEPQNKIILNQNNLLLYGENGSGKSSIYWALYTFLQSCFKEDSEIEKYFDPTNPQNLRNRFAEDTDNSGILLEFIDSNGTIISKEISNILRNIKDDKIISKILSGSDFINYKYLSKLYDFRNSEEINLFEWFEREIFMFIDFGETYIDNAADDDVDDASTFASDWWKFISNNYNNLPKNKRKYNTPKQNSPEYIRYTKHILPRFVKLLKKFLGNITTKANEYLKEEFKEDFEIDFSLRSIKCEYNKTIRGKSRDGKLHIPKIPLKVKFNHDDLDAIKKKIAKPHTFLNEARLTAIALSIRLAMLDERPILPNTARLLILDDLLLSLDMSHRDKVLDIVLSLVDDYQILIFTHDRAFYNLCKNRIENRFDSGWEFKEMYKHITEDNIPCPFIPDKKSYLDLAHKYLKEYDYPACANYLRKETERLLKKILPSNLILKDDLDTGSKQKILERLLSTFKKYYEELGGDFTPFIKLKEYKDLLMNPLSHDNLDSPLYRVELENMFEIIKDLNLIEIKTFGNADSDNENPYIIKETDNNGDDWEYTFYLKETFRAVKDLNSTWLLSNPMVVIGNRRNITKNLSLQNFNTSNTKFKLLRNFERIRHGLGIQSNVANNLIDVIYRNGAKLI